MRLLLSTLGNKGCIFKQLKNQNNNEDEAHIAKHDQEICDTLLFQ